MSAWVDTAEEVVTLERRVVLRRAEAPGAALGLAELADELAELAEDARALEAYTAPLAPHPEHRLSRSLHRRLALLRDLLAQQAAKAR